VHLLTSLNPVVDRGELLASSIICFVPGKRTILNHCMGGLVSTRAGLDGLEKEQSVAVAINLI
jgi:hypothetical protein